MIADEREIIEFETTTPLATTEIARPHVIVPRFGIVLEPPYNRICRVPAPESVPLFAIVVVLISVKRMFLPDDIDMVFPMSIINALTPVMRFRVDVHDMLPAHRNVFTQVALIDVGVNVPAFEVMMRRNKLVVIVPPVGNKTFPDDVTV